jgi:hypothetical protein
MVKGYPNFIENYIGASSHKVKREELLLNIFRIKKIRFKPFLPGSTELTKITISDWMKIVKVLDIGELKSINIKDSRIKNIFDSNLKLLISFSKQCYKHNIKYEASRKFDLLDKPDFDKMTSLILPHKNRVMFERAKSSHQKSRTKYINSNLNRKINDIMYRTTRNMSSELISRNHGQTRVETPFIGLNCEVKKRTLALRAYSKDQWYVIDERMRTHSAELYHRKLPNCTVKFNNTLLTNP